MDISSKPTATEVIDAYYNLDKPVGESLDNTGFGSNEKRDNDLEVLRIEVATECDALIRKICPGKKEQRKRSLITPERT